MQAGSNTPPGLFASAVAGSAAKKTPAVFHALPASLDVIARSGRRKGRDLAIGGTRGWPYAALIVSIFRNSFSR
jgi:hypothetical protein